MPDLSQLLADQLTLNYGTLTLADGISAAMDDASKLIKAGYTKAHHSENTGLRIYASEAGGCGRAIGLRLLGLVKEEHSEELRTTFLIGDLLHAALQAALLQVYPDFEGEKSWLLDHISGRADGLYHLENYKTVLEIKSCSKASFSFSLWKGPQPKHILQAALSALAFGADKLHIIYISKEPVKRPKTVDSSLPEHLSLFDWQLDLDREQATAERARLKAIALQVFHGELPDTETAFGWIDDPDLFKAPCSWCPSKPLCKQLGPGTLPVRKVLELYPLHVLPLQELAL